eukprot:1255863-Amphidinium_carterae.1
MEIILSLGHGLRGLLPSIPGTVSLLGLWENGLEGRLPDLHMLENSTLLVHSNDFSCRLPALQTWREMNAIEFRAIPQGPHQTFRVYMDTLGLHWINPEELILGCNYDEAWNLPILDVMTSQVGHELRKCLRHWLLTQAEQRRARLLGVTMVDTETTCQLIRGSHPLRRHLIAMIGDGLWTQKRKYDMRGTSGQRYLDNALCPFCNHSDEDIEHFLYHCQRWKELREPIHEHLPSLHALAPCSRYCLVCTTETPNELRKVWPLLQDTVVKMWEARLQCQDSESAQVHPRQQLPASDPYAIPAIPDPTPDCLDFTLTYTLRAGNRPWTATRYQWHQFTHFMSRCRLMPPTTDERQYPCLLEMYLSFLVTNGMHRWHSGTPDAQHGDRISLQCERFRQAVLSFQVLAQSVPLVPVKSNEGPWTTWVGRYGFPRQQTVLIPLWLPNWTTVRTLLAGSSSELVDALARLRPSKGLELWRHWTPGKTGTQMHFGGRFRALLWLLFQVWFVCVGRH